MDLEKQLEALQKIEAVPAPPYLLTRIHQRIQLLTEVTAPATWKWAFAGIATLLIILNATVLLNNNSPENSNNMQELVNAMHLTPTNNLYNE